MNLESAYAFGELEEEYMQKKIAQGNEMIKYMSQTIDDFRSFFLPDQQQESFDIVSSIEQSLQIVSASLNYCHIEIRTQMQKGLFFVKGYPNEFAQAILNLINNARDALSKVSSKTKYISVSIKKENGGISILICDNGGGIDAKLLPDIFEPYVTGKQDSGGTGVGLYITRLIIEQKMQGKIEAYNNMHGACFEIKF
jgi:signal transduction histidine kinase